MRSLSLSPLNRVTIFTPIAYQPAEISRALGVSLPESGLLGLGGEQEREALSAVSFLVTTT